MALTGPSPAAEVIIGDERALARSLAPSYLSRVPVPARPGPASDDQTDGPRLTDRLQAAPILATASLSRGPDGRAPTAR